MSNFFSMLGIICQKAKWISTLFLGELNTISVNSMYLGLVQKIEQEISYQKLDRKAECTRDLL